MATVKAPSAKAAKKAPVKRKPRAKVVVEPEVEISPRKIAEPNTASDEGFPMTEKEVQAKMGEGATVQTIHPFKFADLWGAVKSSKLFWPGMVVAVLAVVMIVNTCNRKAVETKVTRNEAKVLDSTILINAIQSNLKPIYGKLDSVNGNTRQLLQNDDLHTKQLQIIQTSNAYNNQEIKKITDASYKLLQNPNRTWGQLDSLERALRSAIEQFKVSGD